MFPEWNPHGRQNKKVEASANTTYECNREFLKALKFKFRSGNFDRA